MSYRNSLSSFYGSGRASPYTSGPGQNERSFSDLYEYVEPVDVSRGYGGGYRTSASEYQLEDEDAPDIIHVRYLNTTFHVEFPPFSISESDVTVAHLRNKVADRLNHNPKKIRLVYKDRKLKHDHRSIKHYGCKQNSEIHVIPTDMPSEHGSPDSRSSAEDVRQSTTSLQPPVDRQTRPRGNSSVRHRSDENFKTSDSSGLLHPLNGNSHSRRRSPSPALNSRARSRSPAPPTVTTPASSAPRSPARPAADPNTPMGKVQALEKLFYDKWYPDSRSFLASPPSDLQAREKESRRLGEVVMRHIIEAADAIELEGDQDARAERKKLLNAANEVVKELDSMHK